MIVPLPDTQDLDPARPWATYILIALCVLVFIPIHFGSKANIRAGIRLLDQATAYYAEHPYLEVDPRLDAVLWSGGGAKAKHAAKERRANRGEGRGRGSDFVTLEQAELDGLTRAGFDALGRVPHWTLAVVPADLTILSLVSHLFTHAAWLPMLANLLFLYLAGSYLEARWGAPLLLGGFLITGMIAGGVFILRCPDFPVPLTGASGAVAGLVGAYAVTFGAGKVSFRYWFGPDRVGVLAVPALVLVALWGLREVLVLVTQEALLPDTGAEGAVYWDHLSGLGCGLILGVVVRFGRFENRLGVVSAPAGSPPVDIAAEATEQAHAAWREGRTGEAWQLLRGEARRDPGNREAVALLWELATDEGRQAEAAPEMIRLVYYLSRRGGADEGYGLWSELREKVPDAPVPAATEVRLGHALIGKDMGAEAQAVLATAASRVGPRELPMTLVMLAKGLQGPEKERIARMALNHPDLPPEERVALEALSATRSPVVDAAPRSASPEQSPAPIAKEDVQEGAAPLEIVEAIPVGIKQKRLGIELTSGGRRVLPFSQVKGIAAAEVYDGGVEPDYVLDLILSFPSGKTETPSVVRLHSGRFDPRKLVPTEPEVGDALLSLAGRLLSGSGGMWLLGTQPTELRSCSSPAEYERELLAVLRLHGGSA